MPVLSVHSTSMLPKFSMDASRRTMTPARAMACEPLARLVLMMAGSSCGVRPTASATENSKESSGGRRMAMLNTKTAITRMNITSLSR